MAQVESPEVARKASESIGKKMLKIFGLYKEEAPKRKGGKFAWKGN